MPRPIYHESSGDTSTIFGDRKKIEVHKSDLLAGIKALPGHVAMLGLSESPATLDLYGNRQRATLVASRDLVSLVLAGVSNIVVLPL